MRDEQGEDDGGAFWDWLLIFAALWIGLGADCRPEPVVARVRILVGQPTYICPGLPSQGGCLPHLDDVGLFVLPPNEIEMLMGVGALFDSYVDDLKTIFKGRGIKLEVDGPHIVYVGEGGWANSDLFSYRPVYEREIRSRIWAFPLWIGDVFAGFLGGPGEADGRGWTPEVIGGVYGLYPYGGEHWGPRADYLTMVLVPGFTAGAHQDGVTSTNGYVVSEHMSCLTDLDQPPGGISPMVFCTNAHHDGPRAPLDPLGSATDDTNNPQAWSPLYDYTQEGFLCGGDYRQSFSLLYHEGWHAADQAHIDCDPDNPAWGEPARYTMCHNTPWCHKVESWGWPGQPIEEIREEVCASVWVDCSSS